MPCGQGLALGQAAIRAMGGKPAEFRSLPAVEIEAVRSALSAHPVAHAAACCQVEIPAGHVGIAHLPGTDVPGFVDTTAGTAIAQRIPLAPRQRIPWLGLPEGKRFSYADRFLHDALPWLQLARKSASPGIRITVFGRDNQSNNSGIAERPVDRGQGKEYKPTGLGRTLWQCLRSIESWVDIRIWTGGT